MGRGGSFSNQNHLHILRDEELVHVMVAPILPLDTRPSAEILGFLVVVAVNLEGADYLEFHHSPSSHASALPALPLPLQAPVYAPAIAP